MIFNTRILKIDALIWKEGIPVAFALVGRRDKTFSETDNQGGLWLVGETAASGRRIKVSLNPRGGHGVMKFAHFEAYFGPKGSEVFAGEVLYELLRGLEQKNPNRWSGKNPLYWEGDAKTSELLEHIQQFKLYDEKIVVELAGGTTVRARTTYSWQQR